MPQEYEAEQGLLSGSDSSVEDSHDGGVGWYTVLAVCCSCVGGLMFGYDSAVVSGLLVMLKDDLGQLLTDFDKELVTSITSVGALLGSVAAGIYADKIGRKSTISVSCVVFVLCSLFMGAATSIRMLVVGRFVVGIAIGSASTTVPVYIAEVAPPRHRGRMVALNSVSTTGGQVIALLAGWQFKNVSSGWRIMLGLGAVPPALFLLIAAGGIPESPRYLIKKDKILQAEEALHKLHPNASFYQIQEMINSQSRDNIAESFSFQKLLSRRSSRNALVVACCLMASQQLCGFNALMYYSSQIYESVGFGDPIAISMIFVSGTNFLFTWVAVLYIDRVGRRKMLLGTMWIMIVALFVLAFSFPSPSGGNPSTFLVVPTMLYVAAYAAALGNVPWQASEFLPLDVRALGAMMISSTNWVCNSLVSLTFLSGMDLIKPVGVFSIYGLFTLCAYLGVYFCYPEVAGLSLEDVSGVFDRPIWGLGWTSKSMRVLR